MNDSRDGVGSSRLLRVSSLGRRKYYGGCRALRPWWASRFFESRPLPSLQDRSSTASCTEASVLERLAGGPLTQSLLVAVEGRRARRALQQGSFALAAMPLKAVKTAKFAVLDAGGLKPAKAAAPRQAPAAAAAPPPAGVTVIDDDAANVVLAKMNELNIAHRTYAHVAVPTVDEQRAALGALPGVLTKNLLLKDKKAGTFLVTVAADRHVDMKKLPTLLGIKANANLRLTDPSILGVEKGAVSPYAAINDAKGIVTVALDSELVNSTANINTHPLRSDRTVSAAPQDVVAFLEAVQHPPKILDFGGTSSAPPPPKKAVTAKPYKKQEKQQPKPQKTQSRNKKGSKETLDRIVASKTGDFAAWYGEVITKSEMIEYGKISGCYILRPWSFGVWEQIQKALDGWIKEEPLEVQNCYFPLFVTKGALEAEEDHVEGFAPEVAWVTKSGETDLAEPIAIRPTSETIMYPEFAKWLRSHRA